MTGVLSGAVTVIGALTLLNLLLTLGVIRRLRDHDRRLATGGAGLPIDEAEPLIGSPLPKFAAMAIGEIQVSDRELVQGRAYIGFFSTACRPCQEQLPIFADSLTSQDRDQILIVINEDSAEPGQLATLVERADAVGRVILENPMGPVAMAFGVRKLPTMLMVQDGILRASSHIASKLPLPAQAHADGAN